MLGVGISRGWRCARALKSSEHSYPWRPCSGTRLISARQPKDERRTRCSSTITRRCPRPWRRKWLPRRGEIDLSRRCFRRSDVGLRHGFTTPLKMSDKARGAERSDGEAEVCADEAACERGDDRARRSWQDEPHGGDYQDAGVAGAGAGALL